MNSFVPPLNRIRPFSEYNFITSITFFSLDVCSLKQGQQSVCSALRISVYWELRWNLAESFAARREQRGPISNTWRKLSGIVEQYFHLRLTESRQYQRTLRDKLALYLAVQALWVRTVLVISSVQLPVSRIIQWNIFWTKNEGNIS